MAANEDDNMLMLSATYRELMHINLYWSLIGSSLLVKNTRSVFTSAVQHSAMQLMCELLHWNTLS